MKFWAKVRHDYVPQPHRLVADLVLLGQFLHRGVRTDAGGRPAGNVTTVDLSRGGKT